MKLVVNHLTRMQKGFICVAGIDLATDNGHNEIAELLQEEMRRCLRDGPSVYQEHAQRALGDSSEEANVRSTEPEKERKD